MLSTIRHPRRNKETYLVLYAAGVFILLTMTGWAASKRLIRELRQQPSGAQVATLIGTAVAALLTTGATGIIFVERFSEGAWTYFLLIPALYAVFTYFRSRLGEPVPLADHLGRFFFGQYLLPYQRQGRPEQEKVFEDIVVPLDGSSTAETALSVAEIVCRAFHCRSAPARGAPRRPTGTTSRATWNKPHGNSDNPDYWLIMPWGRRLRKR